MTGTVSYGLPRDAYDRLAGVNWSGLKLLLKSPAHYRANLLAKKQPDSDARKRGRAVHAAVLEPEKFRAEFVTYYGRRAGKVWEAFAAEHAGAEILTEAMEDRCLAIAEAVRGHAPARPYLTGGRSELSLEWLFTREAMGPVEGYETRCKSRLDFVAMAGAIVDLKTTRDSSPGGFGREVARYSYHCQAAFYVDAYFAATGQRLPYVWVAVEAEEPFVPQVYRLTPEAYELGRSAYIGLLDKLNDCTRLNSWPGYGEGELAVELPAWMLPDDDESEDLSGLGLLTAEANQ